MRERERERERDRQTYRQTDSESCIAYILFVCVWGVEMHIFTTSLILFAKYHLFIYNHNHFTGSQGYCMYCGRVCSTVGITSTDQQQLLSNTCGKSTHIYNFVEILINIPLIHKCASEAQRQAHSNSQWNVTECNYLWPSCNLRLCAFINSFINCIYLFVLIISSLIKKCNTSSLLNVHTFS